MCKVCLIAILAVSGLSAASWNLAANFDAPNNPSASGVFSYGWGANPAGFAPLTFSTLNCFSATPTECLGNGISFPGAVGIEWNGTGATVGIGTVSVYPSFLTMDPQTTAGVIVRFTAPWPDTYNIAGSFISADSGQHLTLDQVYQNNTILASGSFIPFSFSGVSLSGGDTIEFQVIAGVAGDCCYLSTGLGGTITSATDGPANTAPEPGTLLFVTPAVAVAIARRKRRLACK